MTAGPAGDGEPDAAVITASWRDPERFAELFDRHAGEVHRYVARRLGGQAAADVVSEVFLVAFRGRFRYDPAYADARPWLYGISAKLISEQLRRDRRHARVLAAVPAQPPAEIPIDEITDRMTAQRLRPALLRALDGLAPGDRELVLLVAWAGLSYGETARALGLPGGTVRSRLHRAKAKIRRAMSQTTDDKELFHG